MICTVSFVCPWRQRDGECQGWHMLEGGGVALIVAEGAIEASEVAVRPV